jgi:hypothetical protein
MLEAIVLARQELMYEMLRIKELCKLMGNMSQTM